MVLCAGRLVHLTLGLLAVRSFNTVHKKSTYGHKTQYYAFVMGTQQLMSMMEKWFKCLFENKHYFSCFVLNNESFVFFFFFFIYCFLCLFILVAKHLSCFFPSFKVYFEFKFFYLFYIFIRDRIWFCSCYQGVCTRNIKSCIFWSVFNYILYLFLHVLFVDTGFQQC
jgi:hypothetical protein